MEAGGQVLLGRSLEELQDFAKAHGQPAYRGKQLYDGLMHGAHSVEDITNVPSSWRQELVRQGVKTGRSKLFKEVRALDGTRKFLLQLHDGYLVETVGIPLDDTDKQRLTVCVSSQVGCPMRCTFCATGKGGFARNLRPHEIVDQVLTVQEHFGTRVSNIVYMGQGEPCLNWRAVLASVEFINRDIGVGARHITISTVGVPNSIRMLAQALKERSLQITLAVSIHAPSQQIREKIVPSAKAYPFDALLDDCSTFNKLTGRRVTFEYTLLAGFNDSPAQAEELARTLTRHGLRGSHVNLIPWNAVDDAQFKRPSKAAGRAFRDALNRAGVPVSVRVTRGTEVAAACGQLRNEYQRTPLDALLRQALQ
ncbi:g9851 [Coccomyxa elongata]